MTDPTILALLAGGPTELLRTGVVSLLVAVGVFFLFVGTFGLIRLPNVYNRMHATTKATTMGSSSIALATWVYHAPAGEGLPALVTIVFLFLTAPTGAHLISRTAQRMGIEFVAGVSWPGRTDQQPEEPGRE